ncbi:MAG: hypothetical protein Ta2F_15140 [Termitinemataceae bacterium]|nr:MAG: hypothetical protein Ta2F_15140 [Termitinemataceae bacterium]
MNDVYLTAIIAGFVPAASYVVTTMITTRRNSEDIKELKIEIKSQDEKFTAAINALDSKFTTAINALNDRFSAIESDVAVIKALCQERSDHIHKRTS